MKAVTIKVPTWADVRNGVNAVKAANELRTAKRAVRKAQREQLHALAEQLVRERSGK